MTIIYDLSKLDSSIQNEILSNSKYIKWFSEFPTKLLGIENDAKTVKGKKLMSPLAFNTLCHIK